MSKPPVNAAPAAPPPIEVRSPTGELWKQVAPGAAETLVARGWGEWLGTGRRRYVRLTPEAPVSSLVSWRGKDGTRPVRADRSCKSHADGQFVGDPRRNREFAPPAKWSVAGISSGAAGATTQVLTVQTVHFGDQQGLTAESKITS